MGATADREIIPLNAPVNRETEFDNFYGTYICY